MYDKEAVQECYWEEANEQLPNGSKEELEARYEQLMDKVGSYGDYLANQEGGD